MLDALIVLVSFFVGTMPASIVYAVFNESSVNSFDGKTYCGSLVAMIALIILLKVLGVFTLASTVGLIIGILAIGCLATIDQSYSV